MPDGSPNPQAKHTKYAIEDSLIRKGEFCLFAAQVFS